MELWTLATCKDGAIVTSISKTEAEAYRALAAVIYPENDGGNDRHGRLISLLPTDASEVSKSAKDAFYAAIDDDLCETDWNYRCARLQTDLVRKLKNLYWNGILYIAVPSPMQQT